MPDDPIAVRYRDRMIALANGLDEVLGGLGFALLVFELDKIEGGRVNYIGNCRREDIITAMREFIARNEGRLHDAPGSPQ
ncbi:hypothetical protein [Burkholderia gladioli]|uniref:hypothetical protein n=1 Tax=Burkholderia gladioli TaxID=28095 RepID=UPI0016417770|nr:hypothetical protein [Burkholderia gladioli]